MKRVQTSKVPEDYAILSYVGIKIYKISEIFYNSPHVIVPMKIKP